MFRRSARQPPTQLPTPARKTLTRIRWLVAAVAAVTSGLAAGAIPAQAANAGLGGYSATISATSPHFPGAVHGKVDGYALVYYKVKYRKFNTAIISGDVTGAANGDVVTLRAEPFGAKAFAPTGTPIILSSPAATPYSFAVQPSVATRYEIQVTTSGQVDVTSRIATVYVTFPRYGGKSHQRCTRTTCTFWYPIHTFVPASAYNTEATKHVYLYLSVGYPRLPKYYTLSKTARASKARKLNSGEYEQTVIFYIKVSRYGTTYWETFWCTKDTETRDGLGLPGHHGCGDKRIGDNVIYVG